MNIMLGYEPFKGFEIYSFRKTRTGIDGRDFNYYVGWAKRESDSKCIDGTAYRTIAECERDMKSRVNGFLRMESEKQGARS